jgi:hypothetical protein
MDSTHHEQSSGRVPAPKVYDHVPPRIDPDKYQVAVPAWNGIFYPSPRPILEILSYSYMFNIGDVLRDGRIEAPKTTFLPPAYSASKAPGSVVEGKFSL